MTALPLPPRVSRGRAWLDLARAGNFPSVWSNVLAALVLSGPLAQATGAPSSSMTAWWPAPGPWLAATLAATLAYAGGATLNDVFDVTFDSRHRPDRAIPAGVVSRTAAAWGGALLLAAGVVVFVAGLGASPVWAGAMAAAIVAYDWVHKRWAGAVVLMAACRAFLALTVASLPGQVFTTPVLAWVAALSLYIVAVSVVARAEYWPGAPADVLGRWVGRLLRSMPWLDAAAMALVGAWPPALASALAVPLGQAAQRRAAST